MSIFQNHDYSLYIEDLYADNFWESEMIRIAIGEIRPFIYLIKLYEEKEHLYLWFKNSLEFRKFVENISKNKEKIIDVLKREVKPIIKEFENDR